jgi:hypothetical protein
MSNGRRRDPDEDRLPFPVIVADSSAWPDGSAGAKPYSAVGAAAGGRLATSAAGTIADVLGWRWRPTADARDLVAALDQAFKAVPRQGRVDYVHQPRSYSVAIQTDMGAVTGAQASIFTRAKIARDQMLALLEGITPLEVVKDPQDQEAIRSLLRAEIGKIVDELGTEGGPNVQLIDDYFLLIGGPRWDLEGPERTGAQDHARVGGHLGGFRDAFGMRAENVNTIAEEQNLTNFIVLFDYLRDLWRAWRADRRKFVPGQSRFLGTQLVQVSRALAVVAETVQEVYFVMDSVFLGPAERQTIRLDFGANGLIFLADLLAWVDRFATDEGRRMINESGKDGVEAFSTTVTRLDDLVRRAATTDDPGGEQDPETMPRGYRTARVRNAMVNLASALARVRDEVARVHRFPRPTIEEVDATLSAGAGADLVFNLRGRHFRLGAIVEVEWDPGDPERVRALAVPASDETFVSATSIVAGLDEAAVLALRDIPHEGADAVRFVVVNPDGQVAVSDPLTRVISEGDVT